MPLESTPGHRVRWKRKEVQGQKKSKHRVTVANASGDKEDPIVIWEVENPQVLSRFSEKQPTSKLFSSEESMDDKRDFRSSIDHV